MNQDTSAFNVKTWLSSLFPITLLFVLFLVLGNQLLRKDLLLFAIWYGVIVVSSTGIAFVKKPSESLIKAVNYGFLLSILFNLGSALHMVDWISMQSIRLSILMVSGLLGTWSIYLNRQQDAALAASTLSDESKKPSNKWTATIVLFLIFGIALYFRWLFLDRIDTFRDEDHHITNAKMWLDLGYIQYQRSKLVTYSVAFFAWLGHAVSFHEYMYWGRIPGAFCGAVAVVPIYFLGKKISVTTGLIASFLWAMSPWAIGVSRNIREHTYYVLIILFFSLLFLSLIEKVINYKKENLKYILVYGVLIAALLVYSFFIDRFSTLKVSGAIFATLTGTYVLTHYEKVLDLLKKNKILLVLSVGAFVGFLGLINRVKFIGWNNTSDIRWTDTFLYAGSPIPEHWWSAETPDMYFIYFLILMVLIGGIRFRQRFSLMYTFSFLLIAAAFYFFFTRYFTPRYIFYNLSFFVLSIAASIYFLYEFSKSIKNPGLRLPFQLVMSIFLFIIFNPTNTYQSLANPETSKGDFALKTTGEFHNEKRGLLLFLDQYDRDLIENEYGMISSIYEQVIHHEYDIECVHKFHYKESSRQREVEKYISGYDSGFMMLDYHRNQLWRVGFPTDSSKAMKLAGKDVKLIFNQNLCQIYGWGDVIAPPSDDVILADDVYVTETELNLMSPVTFSFWLKKPDKKLEEKRPFYITELEYSENLINVVVEEQKNRTYKLKVQYGNFIDGEILDIPFPNDDQWHHVVVQQSGGFKGSPYQVYLDGVQKASSKLPIHRLEKAEIYITTEYIDYLKNFKYYARKLNGTDIKTLFDEGTVLQPNAPITEDATIVNALYPFE